MLYVKKEKLKNIFLNSNNFAVLMDFDRTITTANSLGSWSVLENPNFIDPNFKKESTVLANTYFPYELDYSISEEEKSHYMDEWYNKNMDLLFKYHLTYSTLVKCVQNSTIEFRPGCKYFLKMLYDLNIPVVILSAGIGNVIIELLKQNNCLYSNIDIISNFIKFENDCMLPFDDKMIHSSNKSINKLSLDIKNKILKKKYILLFGDLIEDLNMVKNEQVCNILSFGFLEHRINENLKYYKNAFDIVLTPNSSFVDIKDIVHSLIKSN